MKSGKEHFRNKKNILNALNSFKEVIQSDEENVGAYLNHGFYLYTLNEFEKSLEDFSKAIEIDPKNKVAYCLRALSESKLGNILKSIQDFNRSLQIDPNYSPAYLGRALVEMNRGKLDRAERDFRKALELDPKNPRIHLYLGDFFCRRKKHEFAIREFIKASKLDHELIRHIRRLIRLTLLQGGLYQAEMGDYHKAISYYKKYILENPKGANAYFYMGEAYMNLEDYDNARTNLEKAIEMAPEGKMRSDAGELLAILDELTRMD